MDKKKLLGCRIRELRLRKGLKQEELAEKVGMEPASICNIENGKNYPSFLNLEKIINVLDVTFTDVFKFEHHQNVTNLITEINEILSKNPEKVPDTYKIIKALTE